MRRWLRIAALLIGMIVCVPLHYGWRLTTGRSPWPRRFLWWVGYVSGVRLMVEGGYRRTNTLFVANHATWLDIMVIGGTAGAAFVAKEELKASGFVHWMASLNDTIWIQRSDRSGMHGQIEVIRKVLESGRAVCFFPEATTKGGTDVLPFRASLFSAVYPPIPGLVVQPVAIDYGDNNDLVTWGDESGGAVANRILSHKGTIPTRLTFCEPLDPAAMDRKQMAIVSRQAVVDALHPSGPVAAELYPAR